MLFENILVNIDYYEGRFGLFGNILVNIDYYKVFGSRGMEGRGFYKFFLIGSIFRREGSKTPPHLILTPLQHWVDLEERGRILKHF